LNAGRPDPRLMWDAAPRHTLFEGTPATGDPRRNRHAGMGLVPTAQCSGWAMNNRPSASARSRPACRTASSSGDNSDKTWSSRLRQIGPPGRSRVTIDGKTDQVGKPGLAHPPIKAAVGDTRLGHRMRRRLDLAEDRLGQRQVPPLTHLVLRRPPCETFLASASDLDLPPAGTALLKVSNFDQTQASRTGQ
jgi:hypothetical protein